MLSFHFLKGPSKYFEDVCVAGPHAAIALARPRCFLICFLNHWRGGQQALSRLFCGRAGASFHFLKGPPKLSSALKLCAICRPLDELQDNLKAMSFQGLAAIDHEDEPDA